MNKHLLGFFAVGKVSKKMRNLLGGQTITELYLVKYYLLASCWLRTFWPRFSIAVGQIIKQSKEINQVGSASNCSM